MTCGTFDRIESAVASSLGSEIIKVDLVAGSVANRDYRIDLADRRRVFVKTGPRQELVAETWAIGRLAAAGVQVPDVACYIDNPDVTPIPFLAVDLIRADGRLTAETLQEVGRLLGICHTMRGAGFGPVEVTGDPLDPIMVRGRYASWREFLESILGEIGELIRVGLLSVEIGDSVRRHAASIEPSPLARAEGVLLHGDLKTDHLLAMDGELTGVIDWGDASIGDPAWDLARASMMRPGEFEPLLAGYPGAEVPGVREILPVYRMLWNTRALAYEYKAGGDWFAEYRRRIGVDLDLIG